MQNVTSKLYCFFEVIVIDDDYDDDFNDDDLLNAGVVRFHPTHGFMLEKDSLYGKRTGSPFGKNDLDDNYV
jgi:hypothetical protein